ncbi:hypothetical protein CANARDRAFT_5180 [[Candida] arabinofermentans NRRL YB-2248]|uniref:Uncharacterized protein n=1 Tax=[Candida] arabinofermentans NRRL YB-2248 TaxID=983967 RepID=A0A1E4T887_9ASCO|nr:hypothetical protein CANARDRAFT_5180 [[Candida] arabinofermentans NRRL YB-2248]
MSAKLFSLEGKTVLITGATNGIGQAMVIGLYEAGANVIFTHRPSTDPSETKALILESNPTSKSIVETIEVDLADLKITDIGSKIVDRAISLSPNGKIDILVNNAGITYRSNLVDFPEEEFNKVLHVNLHVPVHLTKLVGAHMLENKIRGKIVSTASLTSFQGFPGISSYCASKGAILQFSKAISSEWASLGINVNCIGPGYIATNMTDKLVKDTSKSDYILGRIPQGKWGSPNDFKGPVVFLCSAASDYITGECLMVDGGWMSR